MGLALCGILLVSLATSQAGSTQPGSEVRGAVFDADGRPIEHADIGVVKIDRVPAVRTRSGVDGRFTVSGLTPGSYRVIASRPDVGLATHNNVRLWPGSTATLRLFLERPGRCALSPVAGTGRVDGTVVDWNGQPMPAHVRLDGTGALPSLGVRAGVDGVFEFDSLPAGRYTLRIALPAMEPVTSVVEVQPDRATTLDIGLRPGSDRGQTGVRPASDPPALSGGQGGVRGLAIDAYGGVLPGATASLWTGSGRRTQVADADGRFSFGDLAPDTYELLISLSSFLTHSTTVAVTAGQWTEVMAALEVGRRQPHGLALQWNLRRSESVLRIETSLGAFTVAVAAPDLLACVDRDAYVAGTLEPAQSRVESSDPPLLRLVHNREQPAASNATSYALRLDDRMLLVAIDPAAGAPADVVGRVVDGRDTVGRIRSHIGGPPSRDRTLQILSIVRLVFL